MAAIFSPLVRMQFTKVVDGVCVPLAFGKLYTYAAGTSTPLGTWKDPGQVTANANPIELDANGFCDLCLGSSAYKFDLFDTSSGSEVRVSGYPIDDIDPTAYSNDALLARTIVCFAGALPPSNPGQGQFWYQPGTGLWQYNGSAWVAIMSSTGIVSQQYTAFTTAGTAPNLTLAPTVPLTAYAAGVRYRIKVHATAAGQPTLNVSGLGNVNLNQRSDVGSLIPANLVTGGLYDVEHDGTQFVVLNAHNWPGAVRGVTRGLVGSSSGVDANYAITCEEVSVYDSSTGDRRSIFGVNVTLNTAGSGANGLDTGTLATSTIYYVWIIYNLLTNDVKSLLSLSPSAPTLPSGYAYAALVGALKTDGTGNKYPYAQIQRGRSIQYKAGVGNMSTLPVLGSGAGTNVACSVSGWVPTAKAILVRAILSTSGAAAYLMANATTASGDVFASTNSAANNWNWEGSIVLESSNIYYTGGAATAVKLSGYDIDL